MIVVFSQRLIQFGADPSEFRRKTVNIATMYKSTTNAGLIISELFEISRKISCIREEQLPHLTNQIRLSRKIYF